MVLSLNNLARLWSFIIIMDALDEMRHSFRQEFSLSKSDCNTMSVQKVCDAHKELSIKDLVFNSQPRNSVRVEDIDDIRILHVDLIQNLQNLASGLPDPFIRILKLIK